jgi:exopolyphosphatase/guanosine-5'-triphosphate,3'-diphosphate pyrophosphatase
MRVAVVDIGSNSIKMLVAARNPDGSLVEIGSRALEVRIGRGIASELPRLESESMDRVVAATASLLVLARSLGAETSVAVATSAVRDASNGAEFSQRLLAWTGLRLRILSGEEEAALIGRGLATDPALASLDTFDVFDLGGGSLECLALRDRKIERVVSLPLGCVRLTEKFVPAPAQPFPDGAASAVEQHVKGALTASGFPLPVPAGTTVVGTGGTLATVRSVAAAELGLAPESAPTMIDTGLLRRVLARVAPLDLARRCLVPGLPEGRADVFPTALVTLLTVSDVGAFGRFHFSLRNLRWGVAAEYFG